MFVFELRSQPFSPVYHGNATVILDDKNEIVSFSTREVTQSFEKKKVRQIRKNLSDSDLAEDDSSDDSIGSDNDEQNVNPWSSRLHSTDFNIRKKCGEFLLVLRLWLQIASPQLARKL